jgi:hypothetical protein
MIISIDYGLFYPEAGMWPLVERTGSSPQITNTGHNFAGFPQYKYNQRFANPDSSVNSTSIR